MFPDPNYPSVVSMSDLIGPTVAVLVPMMLFVAFREFVRWREREPGGIRRPSLRESLMALQILAIVLAAFLVHISFGSWLAGSIALTVLRTREVLGRCRRAGLSPNSPQRTRLICGSFCVSALIVALSSFVCFDVFSSDRWRTSSAGWARLSAPGVVCGLLAGFATAAILKAMFWPYRGTLPGQASTSVDNADL